MIKYYIALALEGKFGFICDYNPYSPYVTYKEIEQDTCLNLGKKSKLVIDIENTVIQKVFNKDTNNWEITFSSLNNN